MRFTGRFLVQIRARGAMETVGDMLRGISQGTDVEAAELMPSPKPQQKSQKFLKVLSVPVALLFLCSLLMALMRASPESLAAEEVLERESVGNSESGAPGPWRLPPDPLKKAERHELDAALVRFLQMVGEDPNGPEYANVFDEQEGENGGTYGDDLEAPHGPMDHELPSRRLQGFGRKIRGGAWLNRYKATVEHYGVDPFGGISCYQTVFSCVWYLGYIGQQIDLLTLNATCPDTNGDKGCSGGITNLLQNLAWFLIAATQIPAYCVETYTSPDSVNCFTSMTTFAGSGIEISSDALNTVNDCAYLHPSLTIPSGPTTTETSTRTTTSTTLEALKVMQESGMEGIDEEKTTKLGAPERSALPAPPWAMKWWLNNEASPPSGMGTNGNSGVPHNRANSQALCAFQSMETVDDTLTVAMNLWAVVQTCVPVPTNATGKESCASDLLSFISSMPNVAQDIFNLMDACPLFYKLWAPCAADAADIAQCSLGVGAWAASVEQSCVA